MRMNLLRRVSTLERSEVLSVPATAFGRYLKALDQTALRLTGRRFDAIAGDQKAMALVIDRASLELFPCSVKRRSYRSSLTSSACSLATTRLRSKLPGAKHWRTWTRQMWPTGEQNDTKLSRRLETLTVQLRPGSVLSSLWKNSAGCIRGRTSEVSGLPSRRCQ